MEKVWSILNKSMLYSHSHINRNVLNDCLKHIVLPMFTSLQIYELTRRPVITKGRVEQFGLIRIVLSLNIAYKGKLLSQR